MRIIERRWVMTARTWGKALEYAYGLSRSLQQSVYLWVRPSRPHSPVCYAAAPQAERDVLEAVGFRPLGRVRAFQS